MSIIPESVIDNWIKQYEPGSDLWSKYPELHDASFQIPSLVNRDRGIVREVCMSRKPAAGKPVYLATCGGPLAGKSTILDQKMALNPERYGDCTKVDPDRWAMLFMVNTYQGYLMSAGTVANAPDFKHAQERAYDLARPGSNILSLEILNHAVDMNYNIAHGTTMTGPAVKNLLGGLRSKGYEIDLLLCNAEDDLRADAQIYRAGVQGFYQSTPEDVKNKGIAFPQKMEDYFMLGDNLGMYWRHGVTENAVECAKYTNGQRQIIDCDGYDCFVAKYERDRAALAQTGVILPSFDAIERLYKDRFSQAPSPVAIIAPKGAASGPTGP